MAIFSPDLGRLIYATFLGGRGEDLFRACCLGPAGELVLVGSTTSRDWPTHNALPAPRSGPDDVIIAKFLAEP